MGLPDLDKIEIVEPPIGELSRKTHHLKLGCFSCFGLIILVVGGTFICVRLAVGPGGKTMRTVPNNFPTNIPVYAQDNIEQITVTPERYKTRGGELSSLLPRTLTAPLFLPAPQPAETDGQNGVIKAFRAISKIYGFLTTPHPTDRDIVEIEWQNLSADPGFVINYYKSELNKSGYNIDTETHSAEDVKFTFSNQQAVNGRLTVVVNQNNKPGTSYATLLVNIPGSNK